MCRAMPGTLLCPWIVITVLPTSTLPGFTAEVELAVYQLSAKAKLQEDRTGYDIQVRFATTVPAVARLRYGNDRQCTNESDLESEPRRNHRFNLPDVPLDQKRWIRVVVGLQGAPALVGDPIEICPPAPFPCGSATVLRVPLTTAETEGVERNEPVTFGIPLPQGALGRPEMARLTAGATAIPITTRALVRWPDRTIKWLLVTGQLQVKARADTNMTLELGAGVSPSTVHGQTLVRTSTGALLVNTGASRLVIDASTGQGTYHFGNRLVCKLPVSRLIATDGTVFLGKAQKVQVEENTPLRAVIAVRGHHVNQAGEPYFGFVLRYYCHAGDPLVRVDHVLQHDTVRPEYQYGEEMKSFAALDLLFETGEDGTPASVLVDTGEAVALPHDERLYQHQDDQFTLGRQQGRRAPGQLRRGNLTVAVRDFWQQWPKSLATEGDRALVGLYPGIEPANRYADRPDEVTDYYYLRDGHYTFRAGFEKRHELWMGPAPATPAAVMQARVNAPLLVAASPTWYTASGALFDIASSKPAEFAAYDRLLDEGIDEFLTVREQRHWYGLMSYGDVQGGRAHSWANIEYDLQHGLLTQYFRTADRRFFMTAEQAARHNADVDVVHYAAGQRAGPGRKREVGQAWVHCFGHTGGYYPYDYKGMSLYAQGYAENEGHMWNQGNLEYYLLTGDEQVRQSAMQLGDWVAGPNTTDFRYGNARVPGWMGIIAMSSYFATNDEYYLNAMRLMYEEVQQKGDPQYGLWIHKLGGGHCRCPDSHFGEAGFMSGVLMTALKYFYLATGDREVAERIVKIARYQVEHLWEPAEGAFRYTSCPKTHASPILSLIMANGLAFAANFANDPQLAAVAREAFARGVIAFRARGAGNGIIYGLPICSAPLAIGEIARLPGPPVQEYLERLRRAALNPARRPTPALVPNPDFEETLDGWRVRGNLQLARSTDVVHSGRGAAQATGNVEGQGEYFVTWYDCGPPWELTWLQPGKDYRLQLWLRVDRIGPAVPAPRARLVIRSLGRSREGFVTNRYDVEHSGTWQRLHTTFKVPEHYDGLYIAVNTETPAAQKDVLLYLDDVTIVPAEAPELPTYFYPTSSADRAKLKGGLQLIADDVQRGRQTIASPQRLAGSAAWDIDVPSSGRYRLVARAKSPAQAVQLEATLDGKPAGMLPIRAGDNYDWIAAAVDASAGGIPLSAGRHRLTLHFQSGQPAAVQKVCLTNEPAP